MAATIPRAIQGFRDGLLPARSPWFRALARRPWLPGRRHEYLGPRLVGDRLREGNGDRDWSDNRLRSQSHRNNGGRGCPAGSGAVRAGGTLTGGAVSPAWLAPIAPPNWNTLPHFGQVSDATPRTSCGENTCVQAGLGQG